MRPQGQPRPAPASGPPPGGNSDISPECSWGLLALLPRPEPACMGWADSWFLCPRGRPAAPGASPITHSWSRVRQCREQSWQPGSWSWVPRQSWGGARLHRRGWRGRPNPACVGGGGRGETSPWGLPGAGPSRACTPRQKPAGPGGSQEPMGRTCLNILRALRLRTRPPKAPSSAWPRAASPLTTEMQMFLGAATPGLPSSFILHLCGKVWPADLQ